MQGVYVAQGGVAEGGFGPAQPLLHEVFIDARDGRDAAGRVAVHRAIADAGLGTIRSSEQQAILDVGQQPDARRPHAGLNVLQGQIVGSPGQRAAQGVFYFADVAGYFAVNFPVEKPRPEAVCQLFG